MTPLRRRLPLSLLSEQQQKKIVRTRVMCITKAYAIVQAAFPQWNIMVKNCVNRTTNWRIVQGVEVKASGIAGPTTCYTDTKDLSIVQTLYNACVSGFLRKQFSDSPRILTSCINEGHGSTLELLHDAMFEDACNKIGGFPDGANAAGTGNYYCTYCNAPNMEFDSTTGCVCKTGYTDADGNITNGCEARQ